MDPNCNGQSSRVALASVLRAIASFGGGSAESEMALTCRGRSESAGRIPGPSQLWNIGRQPFRNVRGETVQSTEHVVTHPHLHRRLAPASFLMPHWNGHGTGELTLLIPR